MNIPDKFRQSMVVSETRKVQNVSEMRKTQTYSTSNLDFKSGGPQNMENRV